MLKREDIARSLRSMVIKKKATAVALAEEALAVEPGGSDEDDTENDFSGVQQFLEDHGGLDKEDVSEGYTEADVAEVLAASWREKLNSTSCKRVANGSVQGLQTVFPGRD